MLIMFLFLGAIGGALTATIERAVSARIHGLIGALVGLTLAYFIGGLLLATLAVSNPWFWICLISGLLLLVFLFFLSRRWKHI